MADVLIVEDEEDICDFLCKVLENKGIEVASCLTGEEAFKLLETQRFKVFVVDLKLSTAVTGLDVIKAIRKRSSEAIVVAMSGYIDASLKESALRFGANEYLEKPGDLTVEVFGEKIQILLRKLVE